MLGEELQWQHVETTSMIAEDLESHRCERQILSLEAHKGFLRELEVRCVAVTQEAASAGSDSCFYLNDCESLSNDIISVLM